MQDHIDLCSNRQVYIDQGQSINLFYASDVTTETRYRHVIAAWKQGIKGLYYQFGQSKLNVAKPRGEEEPPTVVVYTRESCPYCTLAKEYLDGQGITYQEITKPKGSVPIIEYGDDILEGLDGLMTYLGHSEQEIEEFVSNDEVFTSSCESCDG